MEEDRLEQEMDELMLEALEEKEALENGEEETSHDNAEEGTEEDSENEESKLNGESEEEDSDGDSGDRDENESETSTESDDKRPEETEGDNDSDVDFNPIEVKVNGVDVKIESHEDMMAYIQKGADAFATKPETLSEEKTIVEQGNLSPEMLKLAVEAQNGSKEALAKIAELSKIDLDEVDADDAQNYKQTKEYYQATEVDRVADEIASDPVQLDNFQRTVKSLPDDFVTAVTSDATILSNFNRHIKEGLAQEIIPLAITSQIKNGGSFMDNYSKIGEALIAKKNNNEQKREVSPQVNKLKKKAGSGGGNPTPDKVIDSGKEIWQLSDKEFAELDLSSIE